MDGAESPRQVIQALIDHLSSGQNRDGGWGAVGGRESNTEATALATLALGRVGRPAHAGVERGMTWLRQHQNPDGSWPLTASIPAGSWTTALAVMCLVNHGDTGGVPRAVEWLLAHRGRRMGFFASLLYRVIPDRMPVRLDPNLRGWAWTANEFSWVEPTAYALIALKKLAYHGKRAGDRAIREAEEMLYDRACPGGGWNYGNSVVYGEAVAPFLETTAVALIALQDRRTHEATRAGLAMMKRLLADASSGLGLSWSSLCLDLHGDDASAPLRHLGDVHAKTGFLGETKSVALALLAATGGAEALRFG